MFFYLSKILEIFLSPFLWLLIILALAIYWPKKRKILLVLSLSLFCLLGNRFLADELMRAWEGPDYQPSPTSYDAGILLGGGIVQYNKHQNKLIFRHNTDRLFQTIDLYHSGKIKKIILSGGSGDMYERETREAALLYTYLTRIGIPAVDILVDSLSDNTHENAVNTVDIIKKDKNIRSCLLITSAFHMRRAKACFAKEGLVCHPFPTNRLTGPRLYRPDHLLIPHVSGFLTYQNLLHEYIGYVVYLWMGYV